MKFWDSSALVSLLTREATAHDCQKIFETDPNVLVWSLTSFEIVSALTRRRAEHQLFKGSFDLALVHLKKFQADWTEIFSIEAVKTQAKNLLMTHRLRADDSLQLAAALLAFDKKPQGENFITLDKGLTQAAAQEGFQVLPVLY